MKAMILAAGLGTRMGVLTDGRPKPLLDLGGESLIERHVRRLAAAGVEELVINIARNGEQIQAALGDGARWRTRIRYSVESDPPLETGGGIVNALPLLGPEPFLVVNADVLTDFDFARLRVDRGSGLLVLVPNPPHHSGGDFGIDAEGRLTSGTPKLTFAGISVLDCALFADLVPGRRPLKPILDAAIERRLLFGERHDGLWLDVGTPERLAQARDLARELHDTPVQSAIER
jgi:N-acetyl-alpha-D-muramate 1-phosphate uridylyltransferase